MTKFLTEENVNQLLEKDDALDSLQEIFLASSEGKIINLPRLVQEGLAIDLRACNNYINGLQAAAKINCPTLCILGDKD